MSKGQDLMRKLMGNLIYEREECVSTETFLEELKNKFNSYTREEKNEIETALFGDNKR